MLGNDKGLVLGSFSAFLFLAPRPSLKDGLLPSVNHLSGEGQKLTYDTPDGARSGRPLRDFSSLVQTQESAEGTRSSPFYCAQSCGPFVDLPVA